jgi:hypothetical protein
MQLRRHLAPVLVTLAAFALVVAPADAATKKPAKKSAKSVPTSTAAPATTVAAGAAATPAGAPATSLAAATVVNSTATTTTTTLAIDCNEKLRLLAGLERQKAKILTKLAGFEARQKQAQAQGRTQVVAALQDQIDENNDRLDEIDSQIDELETRCP